MSPDEFNASSPDSEPPSELRARKTRHLPFSNWWPLIVGALIGVMLRLLYSGKPGGAWSAMNGAFIYLAPALVGAVTVYVAELKQRRSWWYYISAAIVADLFFVIGTLVILIEGLICAIVVIPLFSALAAIGGLAMGAVCRVTRWRRPALYSVGVLPLMLGFVPGGPTHQQIGSVERTIVIDAPAEQVWWHIHNARDIRPEEIGHAWMYRIGVPLALSGVTEETAEGFVRKVEMGKMIRFEQLSSDWQPNRHVRWTYRFQHDSIPPRALDDHVMIGGHYFDLLDTRYTLTPRGVSTTELKIQMQYRVSTQFNWYADTVAKLLIGNFEDVVLNFYRNRATQT